MNRSLRHSLAPWTIQQVERLKKRQKDSTKHEYTCGYCSNILEPTTEGWICPKCHTMQYWCHATDIEPTIGLNDG